MSETPSSTGRKLNMEEKRKLEKMLLGDVERAQTSYAAAREENRKAACEKVGASIPTKVRALFEANRKAVRESARLEQELDALGWDIGYHGALSINGPYGTQPSELKQFDQETAEHKKKLEALKRTYTLKLFAGGEEAQQLFASLAKELAAILK